MNASPGIVPFHVNKAAEIIATATNAAFVRGVRVIIRLLFQLFL